MFVITLLLLSSRIRSNADFGFQLPGLLPDGVAVVGGVGHNIAPLSRGQDQMQKLSTSAHGRVQFGRQTSSTASQAASGVAFFFFSAGWRRPVDETGWAFTLLESR